MIFNDFHFLRPEWLLALLPLMALGFWLQRQKKRQGNWAAVCDPELLPYLLQARSAASDNRLFWPLALGFVLTVIALAGPSWERLPAPAFRNEAGLVIALNLSETMNATDIKSSRLIRSRYKIADLLKQRRDGQSALLVYSRQAFTVTPLTDDINTILNQLRAIKTDIMPVQGRNTLAAIRQAVDLLQQAGVQQGDILLITDGTEDLDPENIKKARKQYRLSVLAVGTEQGAPIKRPGGGFVKDSQGNIVVAGLKLAALKRVASAGGGILVRLSADDSDIQRLGRLLNQSSHESQQKNPLKLNVWRDFGPWLLWLIVPLMALGFRKGLLGLVFVLLLPLPENSMAGEKTPSFWQDLWQTRDQQAQQSFNQKNYPQAAELFQSPAWRAAAQYRAGQYQQAAKTWEQLNTADTHYNRGNALAKAGKLSDAIKAYEQALKIKPDFKAAEENKKIIEDLLKKQQQQSSDSQSSSEKNSSDEKKASDASEKNQSSQNQNSNTDKPKDQQNSSQNTNPQNHSTGQQDDNSQEQNQSGQNSDQKEAEQQQEKPADSNEAQAQQTSEKPEAEKPEASHAIKDGKPDEDQQALEQWLNRVPDDPAGLLRRKFRYQYQQRRR